MTDRPPPRIRKSSRIILLDPANRVLLLRFQMQRSDGPYAFWVTPGGEAEPHEDSLTCARRELLEELNLDLPLSGPVHHTVSRFEFLGEWVEGHDSFYWARFDGDATFTGTETHERDMHRDTRWFAAHELADADAPVFPRDLADVIARLTA